jgi:hypothetical protein
MKQFLIRNVPNIFLSWITLNGEYSRKFYPLHIHWGAGEAWAAPPGNGGICPPPLGLGCTWGGHVMLPATALVMFETYFGYRLLSVRRRTLKCQQWGYKVKNNFHELRSRNNFVPPLKKTMVTPLRRRRNACSCSPIILYNFTKGLRGFHSAKWIWQLYIPCIVTKYLVSPKIQQLACSRLLLLFQIVACEKS